MKSRFRCITVASNNNGQRDKCKRRNSRGVRRSHRNVSFEDFVRSNSIAVPITPSRFVLSDARLDQLCDQRSRKLFIRSETDGCSTDLVAFEISGVLVCHLHTHYVKSAMVLCCGKTNEQSTMFVSRDLVADYLNRFRCGSPNRFAKLTQSGPKLRRYGSQVVINGVHAGCLDGFCIRNGFSHWKSLLRVSETSFFNAPTIVTGDSEAE